MTKRGRPRKPPSAKAVQTAEHKAEMERIKALIGGGDKPPKRRGRPPTRWWGAEKFADKLVRLAIDGKSRRDAVRQMAQGSGYTPAYVRQQIDWCDRHLPEFLVDLQVDAMREERLLEEHKREQRMQDAAD